MIYTADILNSVKPLNLYLFVLYLQMKDAATVYMKSYLLQSPIVNNLRWRDGSLQKTLPHEVDLLLVLQCDEVKIGSPITVSAYVPSIYFITLEAVAI